MKVEVKVTESFKKAAKPLIKSIVPFSKTFRKCKPKLLVNPKIGTSPGNNAYKIRLKVRSKGKGKSGGARIISYLEKI